MQMAGRVAEELFCHDISSGAKDDIEAATKLARKMVTQWGMSEKLGPVSYSDEEEYIFLGSEITRAKKHGEQVSQLIDEEIQALLQQAYQAAKQMCQDHTRELAAVADALLKIETLTAEDVNRILAGETPESLLAKKAADEQTKRLREKSEEFPGGHAAGDSPSPAVSPA